MLLPMNFITQDPYRVRLISNFCRSLSVFGRETSNVVFQILRVVDLVHNLTQATLILVAVLSFQGTDA